MLSQYVLNHKHVPVPPETKYVFKVPEEQTILPASYDISSFGPPIWDQGNLGSCTAHAALRSVEYALKRHYLLISQPLPVAMLSRAFVYAMSRIDSGEPVTQDTGSTIHDTLRALARDFTVDEIKYPYTPDHFLVKPPDSIIALAKATFHHIVYYQVPQTLYAIKHAIYYGRPVAFGAQVYSSFMSDAAISSGHIPLPDTTTETLEGGHAITLVGWDDASETFLFANSWGTDIGLTTKRGYFTMPYKYVLDPNLCSDFWYCDIFY